MADRPTIGESEPLGLGISEKARSDRTVIPRRRRRRKVQGPRIVTP